MTSKFYDMFFLIHWYLVRFATELSGRKARRRNWDGLANEMVRAGWFVDT